VSGKQITGEKKGDGEESGRKCRCRNWLLKDSAGIFFFIFFFGMKNEHSV